VVRQKRRFADVFLVAFHEFFVGSGTNRCKAGETDGVVRSITVAAMWKKRFAKYGHGILSGKRGGRIPVTGVRFNVFKG
jgi:hypothetical protein